MKIHFVIGPTNSGKTTFRKAKFPELECADILDFQQETLPFGITKEKYQRLILRTYAKHRKLVLEIAKEGKDFVIEHTLLKAQRRVYYINKLKQHDLICWHTTNMGIYGDIAKGVYEIPTLSEGFSEIHAIPDKEGKLTEG